MFVWKRTLRKIIAPIYYLPYYCRLKINSKRNDLCILEDRQLEEFLSVRQNIDSKVIGVIQGHDRTLKKHRRKWFQRIDLWENHIKDLKNTGRGALIIVFQDYGAEKTAAGLRRMGYRDGIDFIFSTDGKVFRKKYGHTGRQAIWQKVEKRRKVNKSLWVERIKLMRNFIGNDCKTVLDIGCWECELEQFLPKGIKYIGCDYVKRRKDTIVCDLNQYEFPSIDFDVAYISGSLEYMTNLEWYFDQICKANKQVIMSYSAVEYFPLINKRKSKSWTNHLTMTEIVIYMGKRGFQLIDSAFWGRWTVLFNFVRVGNHSTMDHK